MPNYAALEAADAAIASGTADAARVASINASVSVPVAVPTSQWEAYLLTNGFTVGLQTYATGTPPAGASALGVAAAKMLMAILASNAVPTVDLTQATVAAEMTALLAALVAEGTAGRLTSLSGSAFSAQNETDLLAMGASTTSQAARFGFAKGITEDDLLAARDPRRGAGSIA